MADVPLVIGDIVLDLSAHLLLRRGAQVHLSPKAFALLAALVRVRPRALSKVELQELLWPGTFVVEGNLANLVREVRLALEDDPAQPRVLRTVHGYGYAWHGQVEGSAPQHVGGEGHYWLFVDQAWFPLHAGDYILGRGPESIVPLHDNLVSRRHAQLVLHEGHALLRDLGSKNGTYVSGQRIDQPVSLLPGDEIGIGPYHLTVRVSSDDVATWPASSLRRVSTATLPQFTDGDPTGVSD